MLTSQLTLRQYVLVGPKDKKTVKKKLFTLDAAPYLIGCCQAVERGTAVEASLFVAQTF